MAIELSCSCRAQTKSATRLFRASNFVLLFHHIYNDSHSVRISQLNATSRDHQHIHSISQTSSKRNSGAKQYTTIRVKGCENTHIVSALSFTLSKTSTHTHTYIAVVLLLHHHLLLVSVWIIRLSDPRISSCPSKWNHRNVALPSADVVMRF